MARSYKEKPHKNKPGPRRPVSPYIQMLRQEKKQDRRQLTILALFVLVTLILTLVMIKLIIEGTAPDPKLYVVQQGSIKNTYNADALIVRDELPLKSPAGGFLVKNISDGNRVGKGGHIGDVISPRAGDLLENLQEAEKNLSKRQLDLLYEGKFDQGKGAFIQTDQRLVPLVRQVRQIGGSDLQETDRLGLKMEVLVRSRNQDLLSFGNRDEALKELSDKLDAAKEALAPYETAINAPVSGIISYQVSGQNKAVKAEDFLKLDPKKVEEQIKEFKPAGKEPGQEVKEGQEFAFLVQAINQDIHIILDGVSPSRFELDEVYEIVFPDQGISLDDARLIQVKKQDDLLWLSFRSKSQLESLITYRKLPAEIILESDRGLKIPVQALTGRGKDRDKRANVMVLRSGYVYEEPVDILREDGEYAIVSSPLGVEKELEAGSIIILNPDAVKAGTQLE